MKMPVAIIIQLVVFVTFAPFLSGLITKIKNNIRMRKGQSVFQPYYNFMKLFAKDEVISGTASWIFRAAPFVVLSSSLAAAMLVPVMVSPGASCCMGDLLVLIFILALGRFFLALSALDTGSSFGGMGSSREMFISSLAEPALLLVIFSMSLQYGSTDISAFTGARALSVASVVAAAALFLVTLAETSRIPVDNQETHLELTMVHEAMVLEYSGRSLALIEMASYIKQMVLFSLIVRIFLPGAISGLIGPEQTFLYLVCFSAAMALTVVTVAVVEVSIAKMRLFRVADFLAFAFVLGIVATVCAILGV